jgi:hypothetical protein
VIIQYTPEGGEVERYSTDDLSSMESAAIERVTGVKWLEVEAALRTQSPTEMTAVLWAFRKRQEPTLRFSHFDVPGWKRRLRVRLEYDDISDLIPILRKNSEDDEEFEGLLDDMRKVADDPADVERALKGEDPKDFAAVSPSASSSTGL